MPCCAAQDLRLDPAQPVVGEATTVSFRPKGAEPGAGVELAIVWRKDGEQATVIGRTDESGTVVWIPKRAGAGEIRTELEGIAYVAHVVVVEPRSILGWVVPWSLAALILVWLTLTARKWERKRKAMPAEAEKSAST